jgi:hypothetical protein
MREILLFDRKLKVESEGRRRDDKGRWGLDSVVLFRLVFVMMEEVSWLIVISRSRKELLLVQSSRGPNGS